MAQQIPKARSPWHPKILSWCPAFSRVAKLFFVFVYFCFVEILSSTVFVCATKLLTSGKELPEYRNISLVIVSNYMYYGEQMVDISFSMPLDHIKMGLQADQSTSMLHRKFAETGLDE
jgi:hypothetical protein